MTLPFDLKSPEMLSDPVRGLENLHPDAMEMLVAICAIAHGDKRARPTVTCLGRTRSDQIAIYAPSIEQDLKHQGFDPPQAAAVAVNRAAFRFSWHCVDTVTGKYRAFDLRDWAYPDEYRQTIIERVLSRWPEAEALDHAVPGGARHFHFALPAERRPQTWR